MHTRWAGAAMLCGVTIGAATISASNSSAVAQTAPQTGAEPQGQLMPQARAMAASAPLQLELPPVEVVGASPLIGSGIDRNSVPAATQVVTGEDLRRQGTANLTNALARQVGGVAADSASGNPFQPTLLYHGFAASPLQGTPQGLAVYVNGMRFNQPFGDTVDWDLLPDLAIDRVNLEGSNPVFGLNALGGSINIVLKNGFTWHGLEMSLSGGSFGQIQGEFQYGKAVGDTSTYVAANVLRQNGWRDLQSSNLQNLYGDIGWRGPQAELHVSVTGAHTVLNGPGTSPVELLGVDAAAQFTAPNRISNDYASVSLNGSVSVSDTTSVQALIYYRYLQQRIINGNAPNDTPCSDGSGLLCSDGGVSTTQGGATIPDFLNGGQYGELDNQTTSTNAYGGTAQVSNTHDVLGLANRLVAGASFDGAQTMFTGVSYIGGLTALDRVFVGPGVVIDEPGTNSPVRVGVGNASYGFYLSDTLNLTQRLAVTLSGRMNVASVDLSDRNGGDLTGNHTYSHFNPSAGVTYQVAPWLSAYAGYAVSNRAPTPAELSCAGPENSCSLANFFVGDPSLQQVVAGTWEAGVRGGFSPTADARITYALGLYRTNLDNDIGFINSVTQGRAYFGNIGQTRRQGLDASVQFKNAAWLVYIAYSLLDATYQTGFVEAAGSNPGASADGTLDVRPGNRLPGIPANQLKFGAYYKVTDAWTVGATGMFASGAHLSGDEANLTPRLSSWFTLNLSMTYQLTEHVQLFAWAQNVTNTRYYTFGTFSPTGSVYLAQAPGATNPRSYSPAAPIGGFGGVRVTF